MMNRLFIGIVLFIIFIFGSGFDSQDSNNSSIQKSLIGHWVTESGKTHYYFNPPVKIMLDEGRRMDQTYTILESHETENWIKIRSKTGYEKTLDRLLTFSIDRKSLTAEIDTVLSGSPIHLIEHWHYVDSKTSP